MKIIISFYDLYFEFSKLGWKPIKIAVIPIVKIKFKPLPPK